MARAVLGIRLEPQSVRHLKLLPVQGEFDPSKKSGVGVDFDLLVRSLQVQNKGHARKKSMIVM